MYHAPNRVIRKADRRAQRRVQRMLIEQTYNDPNARTTRLWHEAERLLRQLKGEPEPNRWVWEAADERAYAAGGEYADMALLMDAAPLADPGDHFFGMPSS